MTNAQVKKRWSDRKEKRWRDKLTKQGRLFDEEGHPWNVVTKGTLDKVKEMFPPTSRFKEEVHAGAEKQRSEMLTFDDASLPCNNPLQDATRAASYNMLNAPDRSGHPSRVDASGKPSYDVFDQGPLGEHVLHLCLLARSKEDKQGRKIAEYLISTFGERLVNAPYQLRECEGDEASLYEGQVALHFAIVNEDVEMVRFLLAHEASLDVRAWGDFFSQQGNVYYGEYPINFCASIGNVDIMNLLLELMRQAGDTLRDYKDKHGNTALHMAVWHGKRDMYEYLATRFDKVQDEKNYCGLSPIELAASRGDGQMFQFVYMQRSKVYWKYGPVTGLKLPLRFIDTVQGLDKERQDESTVTCLNTIVRKGHMTMLDDPILLQLLQLKWDTFAKKYFYFATFLYLCDISFWTWLVYYARYGAEPGHSVEAQLAWNLVTGDSGITCKDFSTATNKDRTEPDHLHGVRCLSPVNDWVYGAARFDTFTGVALELCNMMAALLHITNEVLDLERYMAFMKAELRHQIKTSKSFSPPPIFQIPRQKSKTKEGKMPSTQGIFRQRLGSQVDAFASKIESLAGKVKMVERVLGADASTDGSDVNELESSGLTSLEENPVQFFLGYCQVLSPSKVALWMWLIFRLIHTFMWLGGSDKRISEDASFFWELAVGSVFAWLYALDFARGFKRFGHLVVVIQRIFFGDIFNFSFIYVLTMMGFSSFFFLFVRYEYPDGDTRRLGGNYNTITAASLSLFRMTIGDITFGSIRDQGNEVSTVGRDGVINNNDNDNNSYVENVIIIGFLCWTVISNVVLMNLLIALMGSTYEKIASQAEDEWRLQWARIILSVERRLSAKTQNKHRIGEEIMGEYCLVMELDANRYTQNDFASEQGNDGDMDTSYTSQGSAYDKPIHQVPSVSQSKKWDDEADGDADEGCASSSSQPSAYSSVKKSALLWRVAMGNSFKGQNKSRRALNRSISRNLAEQAY